jgi:hypothetical protein
MYVTEHSGITVNSGWLTGAVFSCFQKILEAKALMDFKVPD